MTLSEFLSGLSSPAPQAGLSPALLALRHERRGEWDAAHRCVAAAEDAASMWVHAYLHRKEGDLWNARYWYARAKKPPREGPLDDEWAEIAAALLDKDAPE